MKETPMQEEFDMEKELQQEFIQELAEFFKIFGDATRQRPVSAFCRPCWRGSEMWGIWQTYWK